MEYNSILFGCVCVYVIWIVDQVLNFNFFLSILVSLCVCAGYCKNKKFIQKPKKKCRNKNRYNIRQINLKQWFSNLLFHASDLQKKKNDTWWYIVCIWLKKKLNTTVIIVVFQERTKMMKCITCAYQLFAFYLFIFFPLSIWQNMNIYHLETFFCSISCFWNLSWLSTVGLSLFIWPCVCWCL